MEIRQQIYADLEAHSQPATLPAAWSGIPAPAAYRAPLREHRALGDHLLSKYERSDLVSAGVFREVPSAQGATPRLQLNIHLLLGRWLVLRRAAEDPPSEIVTCQGCLSGDLPPVLAALSDAATQRYLKESERLLFATTTVEDAAILQAMGFPAMPAAGLENLSGPHFTSFCRAFGVVSYAWDVEEDQETSGVQDVTSASSPPGAPPSSPPVAPPGESAAEAPLPGQTAPTAAKKSSDSEDERDDFDLCLVACSLAQLSLDEPRKLAPIVASLQEFVSTLELVMDQIYIWRPTAEWAQKLSFALSKNVVPHVQGLLTSIFSSSIEVLLPQVRATPTIPPRTIDEAWDSFREGGVGQDDSRDDYLQDFREIVQEVKSQLLQQVEALTDPQQKARALVNAQFMGRQLEMLPHLGLSGKVLRPAGNGLLRPADAEAFEAGQQQLRGFLDATNPARKPR